jgi:hypothetical protein
VEVCVGIRVTVGDGVAVNVGGRGVWVAVRVGVDGTTLCVGGVRQPVSSEDMIHKIIHIRLGILGMD